MTERMSAANFRDKFKGALGVAKKPNKYRAQRTEVDGIKFDSKKEAQRWAYLRLLQRSGEIAELRRQVPIMLEGRDGPVLTRKGQQMRLTVDFAYTDARTGNQVFEDTKGMITRDYEVRCAVALAQGIEVVEV